MERYFDAFLYLANWGTRRLMFRFPRALLDAEVARQYCHTDAASVIETGDHVIISLYLDRDPDNYWVEAEDRLGPMVQARSDLAAGDLRLLCLGWLLGAQQAGEDDEDVVNDTEPPVPAGLGDLSALLRATCGRSPNAAADRPRSRVVRMPRRHRRGHAARPDGSCAGCPLVAEDHRMPSRGGRSLAGAPTQQGR
ncbi:MAG: hypothetical protein ACRDNW_19460, partial [Trebonia sp.]